MRRASERNISIIMMTILGVALSGNVFMAVAWVLDRARPDDFAERVRMALLERPVMLQEAMTILQARQAQEEQRRVEAQREAVRAERQALFGEAADPVRGNPAGDVTIVEFLDARCQFCRRLHGEMQALLESDRNVRVVLKDLPVLGPQSVLAAQALLAAHRQGGHARMLDALMRMEEPVDEQSLRSQAIRLGLDWDVLQRDMRDPSIMDRISRNVELARRLGIAGTPALVVGDHVFMGFFDRRSLQDMVTFARSRRTQTN
jgi:protein-disulfide isomerase